MGPLSERMMNAGIAVERFGYVQTAQCISGFYDIDMRIFPFPTKTQMMIVMRTPDKFGR